MAHLEMTDADKTALGWYNQNIQGRYCQRCGAAGPPAAGGWISASLTVVSCMPTVTGEWTWRGRACRAGRGPRRGTQCLDCADCTARCVHGIELPRGWRRPKDVLLSRACRRRCRRPHGTGARNNRRVRQVKNSMDRRGFLRLGAFGTAALAAGTGCGEEALPPAPYEGTPHFVRSAAPG